MSASIAACIVAVGLAASSPASPAPGRAARPTAGVGLAASQRTQVAPADDDTAPDRTRPARQRGARWERGVGGPPSRRFTVGVEGVIAQAPPLRPRAVDIDPRFLGRTVALGGLGLFGRFRPVSLVAVDATVRTASVRYVNRDDDGVVSEDRVLADVGVLLYLARGEIAQFGFDAGIGGAWGRIAYEPGTGPGGTQTFGSGLVRVGADAEFIVKRVAFVLSLRTVALFTDPSRVRSRGSLFAGDRAARADNPEPALQTWLVGSGGIAYRF